MKKTKNSGGALWRQLAAANSKSEASGRSESSLPGITDSRKSSDSQAAVNGINFGKAPRTSQTSSKTGSSVTKFIENTLKGGLTSSVSSLFSGSGFGVIGSLLSGLLGGHKSAPAPLTAFTLPESQVQNVTVRGSSASINVAGQLSGHAYGQLPGVAVSTPSLADQSQQIAQAVKTALLQSHSLADVIGEL